MKRNPAKKLWIKDIVNAEFHRGLDANYIVTPLGERATRVRVLATVVDKRIGEKVGHILLDDATETIRVRAFNEQIELIAKVNVGDIVEVIGKVKEYDNEIYINPEIVRVVHDPNYELLRRLELTIKDYELKKKLKEEKEEWTIKEEKIEEVPKEEKEEKEEYEDRMEQLKIMVLNLIEELDKGDGVKYITLLEKTKLSEEELEDVLAELMNEGSIYEPTLGRFKRV